MCFQTCYMQEEANSPTSTESPPVILSCFIYFLGDYTPKTAIEPDLDYIVQTENWGIEGLWLCGICGATNRDIGVMSFHVCHDHAVEKCRFCDLYFSCMFSMDAHYQETHADLISIDCKLCEAVLPNSAALELHLEWHPNANRCLIPHKYADMCQKCYKFFPRGSDFNNHRAFCLIKQALEMGKSAHRSGATAFYPAAVTPEPVIMTQEGHQSSSAHSLKQLITDTLHSGMKYTNAASLRQGAATNGQCSSNVECIFEPDNQGIKIISGDSTSWQD